jgi:hypothetical protein
MFKGISQYIQDNNETGKSGDILLIRYIFIDYDPTIKIMFPKQSEHRSIPDAVRLHIPNVYTSYAEGKSGLNRASIFSSSSIFMQEFQIGIYPPPVQSLLLPVPALLMETRPEILSGNCPPVSQKEFLTQPGCL